MNEAHQLLDRAMNVLDGGLLYRLDLQEKIRAYLAEPEVKREALSDEYLKIHFWRRSEDYRVGFVAGIRFAEKHHGISSTIPSLNDTISANSRDLEHE